MEKTKFINENEKRSYGRGSKGDERDPAPLNMPDLFPFRCKALVKEVPERAVQFFRLFAGADILLYFLLFA